jgi:hypothetical protein
VSVRVSVCACVYVCVCVCACVCVRVCVILVQFTVLNGFACFSVFDMGDRFSQ